MQNYWKKILIGLGLCLLGCFIIRFIKIISAYKDFKRTLPKHLENNFGEKLAIDHDLVIIIMKVGKLGINIKGSAEISQKGEEIIRVVKSYLINFYPILTKGRINITVEKKEIEQEEEIVKKEIN